MAKDTRQLRSRAPLALVVSVPLCLGVLDAYPRFQKQFQAPPPPISGHLPRHLQANQAARLQFLNRDGKAYHLQLERLRSASSEINAEIIPGQNKEGHLNLLLPGLEPGVYRPQWLGADSEKKPWPTAPLIVHPPQPQLLSDRTHYLPGDTLGLWNKTKTPFQGAWTLLNARGTPVTGGVFQEAVTQKLTVPQQTGSYQLQVEGFPRLNFQIEAPARPLYQVQVRPLQSHYVPGLEQKLGLWILDRNDQAMQSGWIRVGSETENIQAGYAEIQVNARGDQQIAFTVSDAQGNLSQGSFELKAYSGDWLISPRYTEQKLRWQYLGRASRKLLLQWVDAAGLQQKLWEAEPGAVLELPREAHEIRVVDPRGAHSQALAQPELPTALQAKLRPAQAHALQSQQLLFQNPHSGALFRYQLLGTQFQPAALGRPNMELLGDSQTENLWLLQSWSLLAGLFSAMPLLWFIHFVRRLRRSQSRPFPNPKLSRQFSAVARQLQIQAFLQLLGLPLYMLSPIVSWVYSLSALLLGWPLWQRKLDFIKGFTPSKFSWLSGVQACLSVFALWFAWSYAPALMPAYMLLNSLVYLGWSIFCLRMLPGKTPPDYRSPVLATLFVLTLLINGKWLLSPGSLSPAQAAAETLEWVQLRPQRKAVQYARLQNQSQLELQAPQQAGRYAVHLYGDQGGHQSLRQRLDAAPQLKLKLPQLVVEDDLVQIQYRLQNPTDQAQRIQVRIAEQDFHHEIAAQAQIQGRLNQKFEISGLRNLKTQFNYQGQWYPSPSELYVLPKRPTIQRAQFELKWVIPIAEPQAVGGEIPIMAEIEHHGSGPQSLGIQLGIPAGFKAIPGNRKDFPWLKKQEQAPGYLNLTTRPIPANKRIYYQFRLRSQWAGAYHFPAHRVFQLEQPEHFTQVQIADPLIVVN